MISDKINQWTLLVGMLPLAMRVGARALTSMPLDARQHEEFFLTAAQSLFGVALLLRLRFSLVSAIALAALFSVPLVVAFVFRDNPARAIESLTMLAWVYLALAVVIFVTGAPGAWRAVGALRTAAIRQRLGTAAPAGSGLRLPHRRNERPSRHPTGAEGGRRRDAGGLLRISRRHQLIFLCAYMAPGFAGRSYAQPSSTDFIAGEIVKIDAERGEVTLRHEPIAHLHLPAKTTVFHYVDSRLIIRARAGDNVRFRADRFEGTLRVTAILLPGMGMPGPAPASPIFRK